MAIEYNQVAVSGTKALFTIPPGPCNYSVWAATTGCFIGPGTALTTSNGYAVPTVFQHSQSAYPGSAGAQMYATVGTAATTIAVYWSISTDA